MIKRYTTYTFNDLPIPFEFIEGTEIIEEVGPYTVLGVISADDLMEDPFKLWDQGEYIQFNYRTKIDPDDGKRLVRANPGKFYRVRDHHPELVTVKDTKSKDFDTSDWEGYYIAPDDASDTYAESVFKEYRRWLNGECYGICVWVYRDGELIDRDTEVWGFIGMEYAEEELKNEIERVKEHLLLPAVSL